MWRRKWVMASENASGKGPPVWGGTSARELRVLGLVPLPYPTRSSALGRTQVGDVRVRYDLI